MPDSRGKPANDCSASDEASKLDLYLQRQLEEDVARIFDESIYSDLEVVCGKLKILTHSCILKARTNKFYSKLEAILHVNIGRDTFDEIYSFISDAYTECDIKNQENEILIFLKRNHLAKSNLFDSNKIKEEIEDIDVYLTPNTSPCPEKILQQISCLSPSTELTKEYYALVPIDGNLLEQELFEQDALSNAFHTIIKGQENDSNKVSQRNKPTTLSLVSSHTPKTIKHSINCDIYNKLVHEHQSLGNGKEVDNKTNNNNNCQKANNSNRFESKPNQTNSNDSILSDKYFDPAFSPDSLITDDPSSSSDYLSAAYACSPAVGGSGCLRLSHVEDYISKMENIFTSSDSGLENTGMLESLSSHKDITLTDLSLTESTLHDFITDETNNSNGSLSSPLSDKNQVCKLKIFSPRTDTASLGGTSDEWNGQRINMQTKSVDFTHSNSSKEEKQRQNEEIVILESSSVSSETGSWESVFPPKIADKDICEKFINTERQHIDQDVVSRHNNPSSLTDILNIEKSLKSTPCFIDAATLVDEEQEHQVSDDLLGPQENEGENPSSDHNPLPSQPVPCSKVNKVDHSPGDWSESIENEDSLEQGDNKDSDSIQKDLSPTIFEMTPIAEDSLVLNAFQRNTSAKIDKESYDANALSSCETEKAVSLSSSTVYMGTTPHNSIMSLKTSSIKQYESEESESDTIHMSKESLTNFRQSRYNESSPIVSGGASIEDVRSPKLGAQSSSPLIRRKIENTPIVTGVCYSTKENTEFLPKSPKPISASAWVVDMSLNPNVNESNINSLNLNAKKPNDRVCENLKSESKASSSDSCNKSRCSVDSDSSEKSGHKFYIDLSTLPDPLPPEKPSVIDNNTEKKNIFSMFIDLGEKSTLKEMPSRLSSSLNNQKQANDNKTSTKICKTQKTVTSEKSLDANPKPHDQSISTTTFERYEFLCNDPNISISEIIAIPEAPCLKVNEEVNEMVSVKNDKLVRRINGDKSFNTYVIHEESAFEPSDLFVKLSDLDKPIQKSEIFERDTFETRMTRSIPENKWTEQNIGGSSRSSEVISSFHSENALSLNRLFPHLKNEFSKSMPISLSVRTRSPLRPGAALSVGEIDEQVSDVSEISSVQSSMCRSVVENSTTEETSQTSSLIGNCQSRLGQDLLRMFLEEIAPDVVVEVSGKRIKAHKCILSSRCQYFAGILSGGWVESAGNVIILPPCVLFRLNVTVPFKKVCILENGLYFRFSFNVVHFALCHIYSGLSTIPDSISIVELATIADMLGLEGLKEAIMFTLKAKYCHHFHRPCQVCTAGVLECFPLSSVYGLDDLYRKCLRWITRYFSKVWPTKAFATLPKELLEKCYQEHIVNLSLENFIDTVYGCGTTVASLQNSRWAESVARMCRRLVNASAHFAAPRLPDVLELISFAPDAPQTAKQALDDCLAAAIEWAPPDETCRAYSYLSNLVKHIRNQHLAKPDLIANGNQMKVPESSNLLYIHASSWRLQCEVALVRAAPRVVGTQAFKDLPSDLRKRLRELGCIMYGPQAIPPTTSPLQDRKCKSTYHSKPNKPINSSTTRSLDMEKVRNSFVPYKPKPITMMGSKDNIKSNSELRDFKKLAKPTVPKVRTTKAQEERAKFNQSKTVTSQDRSLNKSGTRLHPFENTKPRYLQPRIKDNEKKSPQKKLVNKIVSSSESSRNSSPIQARNLRSSRLATTQVCEHRTHMSQDSLATSSRPRTAEPSTDSLSESQNSNKYATYTKSKHTKQGSVESVISAKCQGLSPSSLLNSSVRTKIPVYLNQNAAAMNNKRLNSTKNSRPTSASVAPAAAKDKRKAYDRKVSGSLMNATKSSSAKMVPKISKESQPQTTKPCKHTKQSTKHANRRDDQERQEIPLMERSGTFLKDEPTFGDKTTDIDIDY